MTKPESKKYNHYKSIIYDEYNIKSVHGFLYNWVSSLSSNYKPDDFILHASLYKGSKRFTWEKVEFHLWPGDEVYITDDNMAWGIKGQGFIG